MILNRKNEIKIKKKNKTDGRRAEGKRGGGGEKYLI